MKRCIIIDIDGTLANSAEYQKKYFKSGFIDEDGYMKNISKFSVNKWVERLIRIYDMEFYDIILLSARHESYRKETEKWLKNYTNISLRVRKLILKSDKEQDNSEFKLKEVQKISQYNEIEMIIDDCPKTVQLLQDNDFNALLIKNLY